MKTTHIDRDTAKQYIYKTNGKIFSAVFTKKNGEKRRMVCRQGVAKYVKGVGLKFKPEERDLIGVFDMHKKAYRFINVKTLEQLKTKGITYKVQ
ncbi:hypothetical protein CMI37_18215 [Candidatus Pacearchaeota archaeon]|nr:hypothetical protein [Candidatus Pacearchaeota archaeon]|tara:strand:- start:5869 stop:6150 length:282 start_codon:yes stop_codon:yes gene_type:complete